MNFPSKQRAKMSVAVALMGGALVAGTVFAQGAAPSTSAPARPAVETGTAPPPTPMMSPGGPATAAPAPMGSTANGNAMTGIAPSKSELSASAFGKLDVNKRGYVTRADVAQLPGFDSAFGQADTNNDGRLSQEEFARAWAIYSQH